MPTIWKFVTPANGAYLACALIGILDIWFFHGLGPWAQYLLLFGIGGLSGNNLPSGSAPPLPKALAPAPTEGKNA